MARGSYSKLTKEWVSIPGKVALLTATGTVGGSKFDFSTAGTVLRMIGEYCIGPTSAPTAVDGCTIGIGIGIVSTDAATLGATALPDPVLEPNYPWLYWGVHDFYFSTNEADPSAANGSVRRHFDIRSMRKFKPRESLVCVIEYVDSVGAPPMHFDASAIRVLVGFH